MWPQKIVSQRIEIVGRKPREVRTPNPFSDEAALLLLTGQGTWIVLVLEKVRSWGERE